MQRTVVAKPIPFAVNLEQSTPELFKNLIQALMFVNCVCVCVCGHTPFYSVQFNCQH